MADQVAEVKARVDIANVIGSRVSLKRAGKYQKGLCPFHSEKTPSFYVSEELQIFKCFGCGKSGDVFTFLEEYEGLGFREALEMLAEKTGVKLERYTPSEGEAKVTRLYEVLDLAAEYYHYVLVSHPVGSGARKYLKERGVDEALIEKFRLGWAPDDWSSLGKFLVGKKKYTYEEVEKAGLANRSRGGRWFDRFRARVMFPLTDFRGRVVGFSGRLVEDKEKEAHSADSASSLQAGSASSLQADSASSLQAGSASSLRAGSVQAKYINTSETALYRKRELLYGLSIARGYIRKKDVVYVVEGEFDVISSYKAGVMNVVGIKGSALTAEQVKLLLRLTRNMVLCLDGDAAGDEAMKRGIEVADGLGMNVAVVMVEGGKDPDEVVRKSPSLWKEQLKKAVSVYEFLIQAAVEKHGVESGVGKKRVMEEVGPVLTKISNQVEQAHYVSMVGRVLGVSEEVVRAEMEKAERKAVVGGAKSEEPEKEEAAEDRRERMERYVWGLVLQWKGKEFASGWRELKEVEWRNRGLRRLAKTVEEYLSKEPDGFEVKRWLGGLEPELAGLVGKVYMNQESIAEMGEEKRMAELKAVAKELVRLEKKDKMKKLTEQIATLEQKDHLNEEEESKLREMQTEFSRWLANLDK